MSVGIASSNSEIIILKTWRFNMNRHLISIMMDSNVFECTVVQANKDIRKENRILDVNATFKNITGASTTNIFVEDLKQIDLFNKIKKYANFTRIRFHITRNSTIVQADSTIECQQKNNL